MGMFDFAFSAVISGELSAVISGEPSIRNAFTLAFCCSKNSQISKRLLELAEKSNGLLSS